MGKKENEFSPDDEVGTPKYLLDAIERVLGPIGLDPCSHPNAIVACEVAILLPQYAPAVSPFAKETIYGDGLAVPWDGCGLVYVNPPYSDLGIWCEKAATEGDGVVLLVPARTGNVYWPETAGLADVEVRLPRVTHHKSKTHAPWHSWLLYYGSRIEDALGFSELGDTRPHPRHVSLNADPVERWRKS